MIPRLYIGRVVLITRSEPAIAFVRAIRFSTFSCFASIATRPRMTVSTRARSPNRSMSSSDVTRGSPRSSEARVRPSPPTPRMATRIDSKEGFSEGLVFSRWFNRQERESKGRSIQRCFRGITTPIVIAHARRALVQAMIASGVAPEAADIGLGPALGVFCRRVVLPLACGRVTRRRPRCDKAEPRDLVGKPLGEGQDAVSPETVSRERNPPRPEWAGEFRHLVGVRFDRRPAR